MTSKILCKVFTRIEFYCLIDFIYIFQLLSPNYCISDIKKAQCFFLFKGIIFDRFQRVDSNSNVLRACEDLNLQSNFMSRIRCY